MMPNLSSDKVVSSFLTTNNDIMMATYTTSVLKLLVHLHKLINNRIVYKENVDGDSAKKPEAKKEVKEEPKKENTEAMKDS